jgi:hypothetical protein
MYVWRHVAVACGTTQCVRWREEKTGAMVC